MSDGGQRVDTSARGEPLRLGQIDGAYLDSGATPSAEDIAGLLAAGTFPVVHGNLVTFLFHGDAESVSLRHFIYGLPSSVPFQRVGDSELFLLRTEIPAESRVEYKLEVRKGGRVRLVRDPLNPERARDPFGANSVLHSEGYETPEWTLPDEESRPGAIVRRTIESVVFGEPREVSVYLPARLRLRGNHPLLIVHDGHDYLKYAGLGTVLDNVVERLEMEPPIVVMTDSKHRLGEYAGDPRHGDFIVQELIPQLEQEFPVTSEPSLRGLMGASFGGVASLATAWQHQGCFGRLLLQSGSFAFSDVGGRHSRGPAFDPVVKFMDAFRAAPGLPARHVFMSCGTYESLIYENRSMVPVLQSTGLRLRYVEARDGHNWLNWRDRLREGLAWLYPGSLWMVYE